jgi:hypothetical protein
MKNSSREPPSSPTMMSDSPRIDASQPTTNRPGAARPSIVKIDAPGRDTAGPGSAGRESSSFGSVKGICDGSRRQAED